MGYKSINATVLFYVFPLTKEKPGKGFITDNLGLTTISSSSNSIISYFIASIFKFSKSDFSLF